MITRIRLARGRVLSLLFLLVMVDVMAAQKPFTVHDVTVAGTALHYLEAGPSGPVTVLLLHGARFTSETWQELATIAELADAGHHVVAFDLPGYGNSEASKIPRDVYLSEAFEELWPGRRVVIVSPSMSGGFSLPLVARDPDSVAGYVPVAPVGIDQYREALGQVDVPTLVVWRRRPGHSGFPGQRTGGGPQRRNPDSGWREPPVLSRPTG